MSEQKEQQQQQQQPQQQPQQKKSGRRRRRRPRRRKGASGPLAPVQGYLWVRDNGSPLIVAAERNFVADRSDPSVPVELVRPMHLESGILLDGKARSGDRPRLAEIDAIEGMPPAEYREMAIPFSELISIDPLERFDLETEPEIVEPRVAELIAPLGKGQRCLIVSPPKAGKTTLLQQMAHAIAVNHPNTTIFVLLVDERPEEVTDWKRSIARGQVFASSTDQSLESHIQVSEMVFERARRLAEMGQDVVVFMDSLTRMSRAFNNLQKGSGRILSGGIDARTMEKPRRFFGSARNVEDGGSLTVVATCLIDTGSRMDEVIFQEFKGTGNMEMVLSRELANLRIWPALDLQQSGTRKEEKLLPEDALQKVYMMRRQLHDLPPQKQMLTLLERMRPHNDLQSFLNSLRS